MTKTKNAPIKSLIDTAFILAAGYGTRMMPLTENKPKPMVEIHEKPMIGHCIEKLQSVGVDKICINTFYQAHVLEEYVTHLPLPTITISREKELLDTGGGLKNGLKHIKNQDFFIINGDSYWEDDPENPALQSLANAWDPKKMDILILLQDIKTMSLTKPVGDYDLDDQGRAIRSLDKTGQYMFTSLRINARRILDNCPDSAFSYLDLLDKSEHEGRLYGLIHQGAWHHISTPEDVSAINSTKINTK